MDKEIKEILKEVNELLSEQGHFKLIDLEGVRKLNSKIEKLLKDGNMVFLSYLINHCGC